MRILLIDDIRMPAFNPLPIQTPDQLSVHIKSLRKARGLTQALFGALLGVLLVCVVVFFVFCVFF